MDSDEETTHICKKQRTRNGFIQEYAALPVISFTPEESTRINDLLRRPFAPEYVEIRDNGSGGKMKRKIDKTQFFNDLTIFFLFP